MSELVQSVDRTLTILEVLSDYDEGLGITELSNMIKLHKSTVHRLLSTLIYKGYVVQDINTNKYRITIKLFELGNKKIETMDIFGVAKPYLKELRNKTNEVIHLVVRDGNEIVYIDKMEADNTIRMVSRIGRRSAMYCTAVGKAIMSHLPEEEVRKIWDASDVQKHTEFTITHFDGLMEELRKVREQGYAIDEQENEMGVRCIGSAVFNHSGEIAGAISISGPTIRVTKDHIEPFSQELIQYCGMISKELGYRI